MTDAIWLAGPIVRRLSKTAIHIWFATREPARARVDLFQVEAGQRPRLVALPSESTSETVPVGRNLHVTLITTRPSEGEFPVGLIAYDLLAFIETDAEGGLRKLGRLKDIGLLGANGVAYAAHRVGLPTIRIDDRRWASLMHGSCRKLHGYGPDRFGEADELIAGSLVSDTRPTALFLTGDQIYADDVSSELLPHLTNIGLQLIGPEPIARSVKGSRSDFVKKIGFTTSAGKCHALSLGEFASLYLLAMAPELWPKSLKSKELKGGPLAAAQARRVLANTPTYMIFDDHEITDDWNITPRVMKSIEENATTRLVVGNGLCAYWAFQDWGNDPEAKRHKKIKDALNDANGTVSKLDATRELLLDLNEHLGWSFVAPTNPPALFIDTRTHRLASAGSDADGPVQLVSPAALTEAENLLHNASWRSGDPMILVAASPVIGLSALEFQQEQLIAAKKSNIYKWDGEYWKANLDGWGNFISWLLKLEPKYVVTLSGDLHYGFQAKAKFTGRGPFKNKVVRMIQLTSSPIKNALDEKQRFLKRLSKLFLNTGSAIGAAHFLSGMGKDEYAFQVTPYTRIRFWPDDELEKITWSAAREVLGKSPTDTPRSWIHFENLRPRDPLWIEERELIDPLVKDNNIGLVHMSEGGKLFHSLIVGKQGGRLKYAHASFRLPE